MRANTVNAVSEKDTGGDNFLVLPDSILSLVSHRGTALTQTRYSDRRRTASDPFGRSRVTYRNHMGRQHLLRTKRTPTGTTVTTKAPTATVVD